MKRFLSLSFALLSVGSVSFGQSGDNSDAPVRVTMAMNSDGSKTVYEFDTANHRAVATTSAPDGKARGKIVYVLDEANRFASGQVFGAKGALSYKTTYKYDATGRLLQETRFSKTDALLYKLVYNYDDKGRQLGYGVFDGEGRLLSQSPSARSAASQADEETPKRKKR